MEFKKEQIAFPDDIAFVLYETNARQELIHSHDCLEINLICEGSGHYLIEDASYEIHAGDLFLINNAEHHMAVHDGSLHMLVFLFTTEFVWGSPQEYAYLDPFFGRGSRFSHRIGQDAPTYEKLAGCLRAIAKEYEEKQASWELMIRANLLMFLAGANRHYRQQDALEDGTQMQSYSRIREAVAYIHAHFDKPLTLEEIAACAAMGKSYFSAYFTKVMKMSVFAYVDRVRVSRAAMLLKTTQESILEIALSSGFQSSAYFCRVFKRVMHVTPGAYRDNSTSDDAVVGNVKIKK